MKHWSNPEEQAGDTDMAETRPEAPVEQHRVAREEYEKQLAEWEDNWKTTYVDGKRPLDRAIVICGHRPLDPDQTVEALTNDWTALKITQGLEQTLRERGPSPKDNPKAQGTAHDEIVQARLTRLLEAETSKYPIAPSARGYTPAPTDPPPREARLYPDPPEPPPRATRPVGPGNDGDGWEASGVRTAFVSRRPAEELPMHPRAPSVKDTLRNAAGVNAENGDTTVYKPPTEEADSDWSDLDEAALPAVRHRSPDAATRPVAAAPVPGGALSETVFNKPHDASNTVTRAVAITPASMPAAAFPTNEHPAAARTADGLDEDALLADIDPDISHHGREPVDTEAADRERLARSRAAFLAQHHPLLNGREITQTSAAGIADPFAKTLLPEAPAEDVVASGTEPPAEDAAVPESLIATDPPPPPSTAPSEEFDAQLYVHPTGSWAYAVVILVGMIVIGGGGWLFLNVRHTALRPMPNVTELTPAMAASTTTAQRRPVARQIQPIVPSPAQTPRAAPIVPIAPAAPVVAPEPLVEQPSAQCVSAEKYGSLAAATQALYTDVCRYSDNSVAFRCLQQPIASLADFCRATAVRCPTLEERCLARNVRQPHRGREHHGN